MKGLPIIVLALLPLASCHRESARSANQGDAANSAPSRPATHDVQIAFVDFFNVDAALFINDRPVFRGMLDVAEENESVGLAKLIHANIEPGPTVIRLVSQGVERTVRVMITPSTKTIMVHPRFPPYITISDSSTLLLD